MKRTLALKKDTLADLTADDMSRVAGGSAGTCVSCVRCLVDRVVSAIDASVVNPTECCQGIPTFHGMAC